jgi:hypothetical protein
VKLSTIVSLQVLLCTSELLFRAMETSRLRLREWIVTDAKTETGWTLSRTKEQGDKLEVVLNGMLSVCPSVSPH